MGEQSSPPHCIKNANGGILKNQNRGLAGWKKWFIIDSKKWVFTVQLVSFLLSIISDTSFFLCCVDRF